MHPWIISFVLLNFEIYINGKCFIYCILFLLLMFVQLILLSHVTVIHSFSLLYVVFHFINIHYNLFIHSTMDCCLLSILRSSWPVDLQNFFCFTFSLLCFCDSNYRYVKSFDIFFSQFYSVLLSLIFSSLYFSLDAYIDLFLAL